MAVGADHIALRDFHENASPVAIGERLADRKRFVAEMVEFQDDWILLATVDTGMAGEETDQVAEIVPLPACPSPPGELRNWFELSTPTASPSAGSVRSVHRTYVRSL
jgi:hypothetical protein